MQNKLVLTLAFVFILLFATSVVSAYPYARNSDYGSEYYEKSSYDPYYGHQYVKKEVQSDPWGETTKYIKVKDNGQQYYSYTTHNKVYDYWEYGPRGAPQRQYLGYYYDDAWRYDRSPDMYHDYYYSPKYYDNGQYWDWRDNRGIRCRYDYC